MLTNVNHGKWLENGWKIAGKWGTKPRFLGWMNMVENSGTWKVLGQWWKHVDPETGRWLVHGWSIGMGKNKHDFWGPLKSRKVQWPFPGQFWDSEIFAALVNQEIGLWCNQWNPPMDQWFWLVVSTHPSTCPFKSSCCGSKKPKAFWRLEVVISVKKTQIIGKNASGWIPKLLEECD